MGVVIGSKYKVHLPNGNFFVGKLLSLEQDRYEFMDERLNKRIYVPTSTIIEEWKGSEGWK